MSSGVVGRSRSRSSASAESLELIITVTQAGTLEVAADFRLVDAGQREDEPNVFHLTERTPWIVLHGLDLHRRKMLGARHGKGPARRAGHRPAPREQPFARLPVDVDDV